MKTKELIAELQKEDPSGELEVVAGGTPIYFASREPAYYDGNLHVLITNPELHGKGYSITGYKITRSGSKVQLHLFDLLDYVFEHGVENLDLSELNEFHRVRYEEKIKSFMSEDELK